MGKIRRMRQKYHLLKKKDAEKQATEGLTYEEIVAGNHDKIKVPSLALSKLDSNIFSGINIDVDKLKTSIEDDKVSVRSVAKSFKYDANGKILKKDEKRKIRHNLFMQKLDATQKLRNRNKKNKNKKKNISASNISDELPQLVKIEREKRLVPKKRGIQKAKTRQKNLLEDISAFQKILNDPKFKSNPLQCVTESVRNKMLKEHNIEDWTNSNSMDK